MLILCPSCHRDLDEMTVLGVAAHRCGRCDGVWLQADAIQEVIRAARVESRQSAEPAPLALGQVSLYETRVGPRAGSAAESTETLPRSRRWSRLFNLMEGR